MMVYRIGAVIDIILLLHNRGAIVTFKPFFVRGYYVEDTAGAPFPTYDTPTMAKMIVVVIGGYEVDRVNIMKPNSTHTLTRPI